MPANKRQLVAGFAALVLILSVVAIVRQARPPSPRGPEQKWLYDLNTGQLFAGAINEIPPIAAPSGPLPDGSPAGVLAHVYGCGDCSTANRVVAYLETYTPEQKGQLQQWNDRARRTEPPPDGQAFVPDLGFAAVLSGQAALVKRLEDADWVVRGSAEGMTLTSESMPQCPADVYPEQCRP